MNDETAQDRGGATSAAPAVPPRSVFDPVRQDRPPRLPVVLLTAVAAAIVAGAIVLLLTRAPVDGATGPVVVLEQSAADPAAICAPLADFAVAGLRGSDTALSGRVTAVSADEVEIVPDRVYRGAAPGLVRLRSDAGGGSALDGPVLRDGDRVLVAATDGRVAACGLSAVDSPELRRYYDAAFG